MKTDQFPFDSGRDEDKCAVEIGTGFCGVKAPHQNCGAAGDANGRRLEGELGETLNRTLFWDETILGEDVAHRARSDKRRISNRIQGRFVPLTDIVKPFFRRLDHALIGTLVGVN